MWNHSEQHLRKALLEQLRRYVTEHQESPHKAERRKWWNPEVEQAIQDKKEEASVAEKTRLKQKYREKKNAANKAVAKARYKKQQE